MAVAHRRVGNDDGTFTEIAELADGSRFARPVAHTGAAGEWAEIDARSSTGRCPNVFHPHLEVT